MEVLQVYLEVRPTMVREVDMKAKLMIAGLKGAWYVKNERPSTEELLFAVQNQVGPLTMGILARFGCKFPERAKGTDVMTAVMTYTQHYGVNILMEMCKKQYSGANGRIANGGEGGMALLVVSANAATLLTTTPTAITPTEDQYPSQGSLEMTRLPYDEDDTHLEIAEVWSFPSYLE
jgi:hypothetical protein